MARLISRKVWRTLVRENTVVYETCSNRWNSTIPSYIYHPFVTILEGEKQAMYLTKSVLASSSLPSCLPLAEVEPIGEVLESYVRDCIMQARVFGHKNKVAEREIHNISLTQNMLRVLSTQTGKYPQLLDRCLTYDSKVAADWKRNENFISVRGRPGFLLCSTRLLKPFANINDINGTMNIPLPDLNPISPVIDMYKLNPKPELCHGFHADAPYPYPHTLFILDLKMTARPTSQMLSHAIMYSHALLKAVAIKRLYVRDGAEMCQPPIAMQCIVTNGRMFAFIYYQLNTLDLVNDDGIKNLVWLQHSVPLFTRATRRRGISNFNKECLQLWLATLMNGIDLQHNADGYQTEDNQPHAAEATAVS